MVLHLRRNLDPIVPADPPAVVILPITQQMSLCRIMQALHGEGRQGVFSVPADASPLYPNSQSSRCHTMSAISRNCTPFGCI
jgi:hypothetical protein